VISIPKVGRGAPRLAALNLGTLARAYADVVQDQGAPAMESGEHAHMIVAKPEHLL